MSERFGGETDGMRQLQGVGENGRTLKWMLKKLDGRTWNGFIWLKISKVVGCCEYGDEISAYGQREKLVGQVRKE